MTTLAIKGMSSQASQALEPHIRRLYDDPSGRTLAVIELEHLSRTMPGPVSAAQPKVDARISLLEVPSGINQDLVRVMLRSLYLLRTARGTFDEASGEISLATESAKIADAVGVLFATEAAEARAFLVQMLNQLEALSSIVDEAKRRRRVRKITEAGRAFLGTGDRELLNALAQDAFDLSGEEGTPVEVDAEATDDDQRIGAEILSSIGSTEPPDDAVAVFMTGGEGAEPVRVGDVVPDVVPDPPAPRKRAARKQTEPAAVTS